MGFFGFGLGGGLTSFFRFSFGGTLLRLTFTEGRKHEVKRYCEALGHRVRRLRRVAFGPVQLGDLPRGRYRRLSPREVSALRAAGEGSRGR